MDAIDFISVNYDGTYHGDTHRWEYVKILHESIKKYINYPYTYYIINNGDNDSKNGGYSKLSEIFKDESNVKIIKGLDQKNYIKADGYNLPGSRTGKFKFKDGRGGIHTHDGKSGDGRIIGIGSFTQACGMDIGTREGNGKYICHCEPDVVFLNNWIDEILPLLEKNTFISYAWRPDLDSARACQWSIFERSLIENPNNFYETPGDLYPNVNIQDTDSVISRYCKKKNLPFLITKNSYNNRSLKSMHVLNLNKGEQGFLPYSNKPFVYHYGRGLTVTNDEYHRWISETTKYLKIKL